MHKWPKVTASKVSLKMNAFKIYDLAKYTHRKKKPSPIIFNSISANFFEITENFQCGRTKPLIFRSSTERVVKF